MRRRISTVPLLLWQHQWTIQTHRHPSQDRMIKGTKMTTMRATHQTQLQSNRRRLCQQPCRLGRQLHCQPFRLRHQPQHRVRRQSKHRVRRHPLGKVRFLNPCHQMASKSRSQIRSARCASPFSSLAACSSQHSSPLQRIEHTIHNRALCSGGGQALECPLANAAPAVHPPPPTRAVIPPPRPHPQQWCARWSGFASATKSSWHGGVGGASTLRNPRRSTGP